MAYTQSGKDGRLGPYRLGRRHGLEEGQHGLGEVGRLGP